MLEEKAQARFSQANHTMFQFHEQKQINKTFPVKVAAQSGQGTNFKAAIRNSIQRKASNQKYKQKQLANWIDMDSTMLSYLYSQRVASMITILSIILSLVQVYSWAGNQAQYENTFYIIGHGLTIILAIMVSTSHHLNRQKDMARGEKPGLRIFSFIINLVVIIPHPLQFIPQYDYLFHLLLFLRLSIPFQYIIRSSMYHNSRGNRLINLYGIESSTHFTFSVKSIVQGLKLTQIFMIHIVMAVIFSHALYLITAHGIQSGYSNSQRLSFTDCFEIVIVTMPTVGYGQYELSQTGQKIIIFLIIIFSAAFNSFVTVSMLRLLEMGPRQISSYRLQKKIRTHERIQEISKTYIIETFQQIRSKTANLQCRKQLDYTFRSMYRQQKAVYDSLNNNQVDKNFTYFRELLHDLYVKNAQTNEMIDTLLKKLVQKQNKAELRCKETSIKSIKRKKTNKLKKKQKKTQFQHGFIWTSQNDECAINRSPFQQQNCIQQHSLSGVQIMQCQETQLRHA